MSINWVMLDTASKDFVRLPGEQTLYTSPSRTSLALQTPNSYPGKEPLSIKCSDGKAFITNRRLVYLPTTPTPQLQSFQSPILDLQDTHVSAPFFGPNSWDGMLLPTPGGGFAAHHNLVQTKLTFKEGGAFDFSTTFEAIKERMSQAADVARENGMRTTGPDVDLEQLPAYEATAGASRASAPTANTTSFEPSTLRPVPTSSQHPSQSASEYPPEKGGIDRSQEPAPASHGPFPPPDEPPPGYDEAV